MLDSIDKADAILVGDLHAGFLQPECRTDIYINTLCEKLAFIKELQEKHECAVLQAGDVFDCWLQDSRLFNRILPVWPEHLYAIPGQHDLPQHALELIEKSAFMTMVKTRGVTQLGEKGNGCQSFGGEEVYGAPWGATLSKFSTIRSSCPKATRNAIPVPRQILVAHVSTWDAPYAPGQEPGDALRLLNSLRGFDLVLTGDNHATFVIESNGRLLVNPGSVMRMESSQKGHRPVVFLYSAQHNAVEPVFLPIDPAAVIDDKLVARKSKESRRNLFVERLDGSAEIGLSFRHNINTHLTKHNTRPAVQSIVLECIGE